jgi:hypothetical protein
LHSDLLAVEAVTERATIVYGDDIPEMIGGAAAAVGAGVEQMPGVLPQQTHQQ